MLSPTSFQSALCIEGVDDTELSELFHENTKLNRLSWRQLGRRIERVFSEPAFPTASRHAFKSYPCASQIPLPSLGHGAEVLWDIVRRRRSQRTFLNVPICLEDLATLLRLSTTITGFIPLSDGEHQALRAAPSGGALYPLEVYCLASKVDGLRPGWFHHNVHGECLERLGNIDWDEAEEAFGGVVHSAAVIIVVTAVFPRTLYKYGNRGYRFVLVEAGHIGAHVYLGATALGLTTVALGSFLDDEVSRCLGIDGVSEAPVYVVVVGRGDPAENLGVHD